MRCFRTLFCRFKNAVIASSLVVLLFPQTDAVAQQSLQGDFVNPPQEARPRVWWHWMNGNVTKDGIYKDLMWMNRAGIGGFHNFDAGTVSPQVVDTRLIYMDEGWKDAFRYSTRLADSLGMEMAVASAPGWSSTGGPWVRPENAMKKLTWREAVVDAGKDGKAVSLALPEPFRTTGFFQNVPPADNASEFAGSAVEEEWYKDIAVLAVRMSDAEMSMQEMGAKVTSSGGSFTVEQLSDGNLTNSSALPADEEAGYAWIMFEFPQAQAIRSLTIADGQVRDEWSCAPAKRNRHLECSDDGKSFRPVCDIPLGGTYQQTISFAPVTARYFRVIFDNPVADGLYDEFYGVTAAPATNVAELTLSPVTRVNHAEEKAGFASPHDMMDNPTPDETNIPSLEDVIDITQYVDADGMLTWNAPAGRWRILRFGYSLTGKKNHPAPPEATGLEVDKLDKEAVREYITYYIDMYRDASGGMIGGRGLQYLLIDSYEAGWETWTRRMEEEFLQRRGYSLLPWMPVLTGQIVESVEKSEEFLWDWRKTIGELIADNLYAEVADIAKENGMRCYFESHENGRMYLVDGIQAKKTANIPMAAMWALEGAGGADHTMSECDIRESAAVAHIYGQNLVALESFTSNGLAGRAYSFYPGNLKPVADRAMSCGVNRFIIHESAHQPVDTLKPGLGLLIFGQWFNRHETWAEQARAWTDYLARSSYMLQQGRYVADILYYYGEDNCITGLFSHNLPSIAQGYAFDYINADALVNDLRYEDGLLQTSGGMQYRMLWLDKNAEKMSLPVLRSLAVLVRQGAIVGGVRPQYSPSLCDDKAEFEKLVSEIWDSSNDNVYTHADMAQVLSQTGVEPDFMARDMNALRYVHRHTADEEIYWISNETDRQRQIVAACRVSGRRPMLYHPETGAVEEVSYTMKGGLTEVSFPMTSHDAVFIVFGDSTSESSLEIPEKTATELLAISTPWTVSFSEEMGAPAQTTFGTLQSWTESDVPAVKYYSGTAVYTNSFKLTKKDLAAGSISLSLGKVGVIAEVIVNGQPVQTLWKAPYDVDITEYLKKGKNSLEIRVTNLWVNRIIGDKAMDEHYTFPAFDFYDAGSPLQPSGLMGPVVLNANR